MEGGRGRDAGGGLGGRAPRCRGYGATGNGADPPGGVIVFEIELVGACGSWRIEVGGEEPEVCPTARPWRGLAEVFRLNRRIVAPCCRCGRR